MPVHDATEEEARLIQARGRLLLTAFRTLVPHEHAREAVEALGMALRLIYDDAPPEFRREMVKFLTANLAEMQEIDA